MGGMTVPLSLTQAGCRFRTVNVLTAAANASFEAGDPALNSNVTVDITDSDVFLRIRIVLQANTDVNDSATTGGQSYTLRYSKNGGGYAVVQDHVEEPIGLGGNTVTGYAQGTTTNNTSLGGPTGSGNIKSGNAVKTTATASTVWDSSNALGQWTVHEFAVKLKASWTGGSAQDGDFFDFQLYTNAGAPLAAYNTTLRATINIPSDETPVPVSDTLTVSLTDAISIDRNLGLADNLTVALTDTISIDKDMDLGDSIAVALDDSIALEKQILLSDDITVALDDSVSVNQGEEEIVASDALAVNISEKIVVRGTPFPVYEGNTEPFTQIGGGGATSIDVDNAPGVQEGDLLIAVISWRQIGTIAATAAGWEELHDFPDSTGPQLAIYTREATASEPSTYNFTFSGTASRVIGGIVRVSNHNGVEISAESSGNSTSPTVPSVNSGGEDRVLLGIIARSHYNLITPPSGNNLRWNETTPTFQAEAGAVGQLGFTEVVGSGATGTRVATLDTTAREWRAVAILIAPAAEGEPIDVSDSLAITIDDQIEVVNAAILSDDATVALDDSISLRKTSQWSDEASATTFAAGDNKEASDSITVALDDQIQIDKQFSLSDSLAVSIVDQIELDKHIALSDDIIVNLDDQIALEKQISLTDDLTVALVDSIDVEGEADTDVSDSLVVALVDEIHIEKQIALSDTISVTLDETISTDRQYELSDSLSVAIDDNITLDKAFDLSDDLTVAIDDQISVAQVVPVAMSDDLTVALTESIGIQESGTFYPTDSDDLAVAIDDSIEVVVHLDLSDSLAVVLDDHMGGQFEKTLADNLTIALDDQLSTAQTHQKSMSDDLTVNLVDNASVQESGAFPKSGSDDIAVQIEDSISIEVHVDLSDDLIVNIADALGGTFQKSMTDNLAVTVSDSLSISAEGLEGNAVLITVVFNEMPVQTVVVPNVPVTVAVVGQLPTQTVSISMVPITSVQISEIGPVNAAVGNPSPVSIAISEVPITGVEVTDQVVTQVNI